MAKQTYTTGQVLTAAQMTTLQANDYNWTVSPKTANYTLVSADAGTRITMTNASATTITVNTGVFTAGDVVEIVNLGAGVLTITAGTATVNTSATLALKQYDAGSLWFSATGAAVFFSADAADSPLTTKGDLYTYSTTNDRLAVGNNGETIVADSSTSTGLRYQGSMAAGKNLIINGGFDVWQRGTSFASSAISSVATSYTVDRWNFYRGGWASGATLSRQLTGDTTNLPFIQYCARVGRDSGNTGTADISFSTSTETVNAIPFAGKTVTISYYARRGANFSGASNTLGAYVFTGTGTDQNAINGYTGSVTAINNTGSTVLTTTWQRFTASATLASNVTEIAASFGYTPVGTAGAADYFEITGVQIEVGSVATQFTRTGGSIQGELAACQRYYWRTTATQTYSQLTAGWASGVTNILGQTPTKITMRIAPTSIDYNQLTATDNDGTTYAISAATLKTNETTTDIVRVDFTSSGLTTFRPYMILANGTTAAYLGFSAEL